jgi:hypothetical protein
MRAAAVTLLLGGFLFLAVEAVIWAMGLAHAVEGGIR